jgi:hypothetical protein
VSAVPLVDTSRITAEGIYGSLAVAVVCLAWQGDTLPDLALEITIYSVALWLFHIYARVIHGGWTRRTTSELAYWARKEWPHIEAAVPALGVVLLGATLRAPPLLVADLAMAATLLNLFAWQVALLVPERPGWRTLLLTLLLDALVIGALMALRLLVK